MPQVPFYLVDSFADRALQGNPAVVVLLTKWPSAQRMQLMAAQHNQPSTAFVLQADQQFHIRWFTPTKEVPISGHSALAAAHVIMERDSLEIVSFHSAGGTLTVTRSGSGYELCLPAEEAELLDDPPEAITDGLEHTPVEVLRSDLYYMAVMAEPRHVKDEQPYLRLLAGLKDAIGLVITAKGHEAAVVSRMFAPQSGVDEDYATGSAHAMLVPYWARRLRKKQFTAEQIGKRKAVFQCRLQDQMVCLAGRAFTYASGQLHL